MHLVNKKAVIKNLVVVYIMIGLLLLANATTLDDLSSPIENVTIDSAESTDPDYPDYLYDNSYQSEYYGTSYEDYYYEFYAYSYDYMLVWIYMTSSLDDFDLYLYTNYDYTSLAGYSTNVDQWDWIVYRPVSSGYIYPKVYTFDTGYAYIEAENGYDISVGNSDSIYLSSSEVGELYETSLSSSERYTISLSVPSGGDFDLYVFRMISGSTTRSDSQSSTTSGYGGTESVTFTPSYTDTYAIVLIRKYGSGTATLTVSRAPVVPSFEFYAVLMGLAITIYLSLFLPKMRKIDLF